MKRVGNLFEPLVSDDNLRKAIDEVNKTHHWRARHKPNTCTAWVEETKEDRIEELRNIILNGFTPKPPRISRRWDASARKVRVVSEPAQWPDQYIHHALIQVLHPVLMRGMDFYCCGSIRGRGPQLAKKAIENWLKYDIKGTKYELYGDIKHFYDSLKPEVVMSRMKQLIKDRRTLDLIWRIVKDGIQIGSYTSQWFANTVLQPFDRMIRESKLCSHYTRYMDNITIFGANKRKLFKLQRLIAKWLTDHKLELKSDWQIFPVPGRKMRTNLPPPRNGFAREKGRLPDAAGYRYGRTYTLIRKHNLLRIKRAIAKYRRRRNKGLRIVKRVANSIISRLGQLKHCNNHNLYKLLFQGEDLMSELKSIVRKKGKEKMTWNMYLERRAALRC